MNEVFIVLFSIFLSFVVGCVAMLFLGGRTTLNYLLVKVSRGKKVLLMAHTPFGWRNFVGVKKQDVLSWKYDSKKTLTTISEVSDVCRYAGVDIAFVNASKPASTISLKEGSFYPVDFDPQTFNNILIRATTRPSVDGTDDLKKMLTIVVVLSLIAVFGILMIYLKVSATGVTGGVI